MADMLSFGAISFAAVQKMELLDKFEELYNDDGFAIFQSKKTYHSDDEAYKPFTYKLIIRATALGQFIGESEEGHNDVHIELSMCPLPEFLSEKAANEIKDNMGVDELTVYDIVECDSCLELESDTVIITEDDDAYDVLDIDIVKEKLDCAATAAEALNSIRGFLLDKPWNLIGNTGWDLLDELIEGIDLRESSKKRLEKFKNNVA